MLPRDEVPILTYHSLDGSGSVISMAPAAFQLHVRVLHDRGFTGIPLHDLLAAWDGRAQLPARPVVMTFDDGFQSVLSQAAPVMAAAGFRGTVFVVTGHCGGLNDWAGQPPSIPRQPLLSWKDLSVLAGMGWEVGAHGATHAPLTALDAEGARREMQEAKAAIEGTLGKPVVSFAYPYGLCGPTHRDLARELYSGACGVRLRAARPSEDRWELSRIDAYYLRSSRLVAGLGRWPLRAYLALRRMGRKVRGMR